MAKKKSALKKAKKKAAKGSNRAAVKAVKSTPKTRGEIFRGDGCE